jgi:hypothetical protein
MRIPAKILNRIQQNESLVIEWAGHRCFYEVIEEWNDSIFWILNLWIGTYFLTYLIDFTFNLFIVVLLLSIISTIPAIIESIKWGSEWHIVCNNIDKGGGVIFKAWGYIGLKMVELDTSKASPTIDEYVGNPLYWIWVKLTGYRMERIDLSSADHVFLHSSRISPGFSMAISRTKSANNPVKREVNELWFDVDQLARHMVRGNYDIRDGKAIIKALINQKFYG